MNLGELLNGLPKKVGYLEIGEITRETDGAFTVYLTQNILGSSEKIDAGSVTIHFGIVDELASLAFVMDYLSGASIHLFPVFLSEVTTFNHDAQWVPTFAIETEVDEESGEKSIVIRCSYVLPLAPYLLTNLEALQAVTHHTLTMYLTESFEALSQLTESIHDVRVH